MGFTRDKIEKQIVIKSNKINIFIYENLLPMISTHFLFTL